MKLNGPALGSVGKNGKNTLLLGGNSGGQVKLSAYQKRLFTAFVVLEKSILALLLTICGFTLADAFNKKATFDSLIVQENRGESRLVVQTRDTGTVEEAGHRSELWALQYSDTNSQIKKHWKLYDFNSYALAEPPDHILHL